MSAIDDFLHGLQTLSDVYHDRTPVSVGGQPVAGLPAVAATMAHGVADLAGAPRRAFRAGVGLDPRGSSVQDLERLGTPRVPAAWVGSFADTFGDPMLMSGMAARTAPAVPSQSVQQMLPLRRQFSVLKDVASTEGKPLQTQTSMMRTPPPEHAMNPRAAPDPYEGYLQTGFQGGGSPGVNTLGRPVGATEGARRAPELRQSLRRSSDIAQPELQGYYDPPSRSAVVYRTAIDPISTTRHEMVHGMINRAMQSGGEAKLPIGLEIPRQLRSSANPTLRGAGVLTDELAARGAGGGTAEMMDFLKNPHPWYTQAIAQESPLIAEMYGQGMIPRIPAAAKVLGIGIPATAGAAYWSAPSQTEH